MYDLVTAFKLAEAHFKKGVREQYTANNSFSRLSFPQITSAGTKEKSIAVESAKFKETVAKQMKELGL